MGLLQTIFNGPITYVITSKNGCSTSSWTVSVHQVEKEPYSILNDSVPNVITPNSEVKMIHGRLKKWEMHLYLMSISITDVKNLFLAKTTIVTIGMLEG